MLYKLKLFIFNLKGTLINYNGENIMYCAVWNERFARRSGNDIASALTQILMNIENDHPYT